MSGWDYRTLIIMIVKINLCELNFKTSSDNR